MAAHSNKIPPRVLKNIHNKSESSLTVTLTLTGSNFLVSAFKIILTHA